MKEKQELLKSTEKLLSDKVLYPFLFAAHFVLTIFAFNFHEIYFVHVIRTLSIALGISIILYILNRLWLSKKNAGILTFSLCLMIFTTHMQFNLLNKIHTVELLGLMYYEKIFYGIGALNVIAGIIVIYLGRSDILDLDNITKFLNLFTIILLTGSIIHIGASINQGNQKFDQIDLKPENNISSQPNIYYIITDKYASSDVLKDQYEFNNTIFHDSMDENNFSVQKDFYTNYDESYASIASSLNLEYLQTLGVEEGMNQKEVYSLIQDHEVQSFLKQQGYTYYHIGGAYTRSNRNADKAYYYFRDYFGENISLNRFERIVIEKTVFYSQSSIRTHTYANSKNYEALRNISKEDGKKFVFGHIMSPHKAHTLPKAVEGVEYYEKSESSTKQRYLQEVKANNILLNRTINEILNNDEDAVIIIQGDEGPTWEDANLSEKKDIRRTHSGIFAHYTPNVSDQKFEEDITPVNVFRKIFNHYFDKNLPIKKVRTFSVHSGKNLEFDEENLSVFLNQTN